MTKLRIGAASTALALAALGFGVAPAFAAVDTTEPATPTATETTQTTTPAEDDDTTTTPAETTEAPAETPAETTEAVAVEPALEISRSGCVLTFHVTAAPGDYEVEVWDDGVQIGTSPVGIPAGSTTGTGTHTLTHDVGTGAPGLGIFLYDSSDNLLIEIDPWDFEGSGDIMRWCAESGGQSDSSPTPSYTEDAKPGKPSKPSGKSDDPATLATTGEDGSLGALMAGLGLSLVVAGAATPLILRRRAAKQ